MTKTVDNPRPGSRSDVSLLRPQDLYLFNEGRHYRSYDKLGAHLMEAGGERGTCFSVWAPNAREVSVIGSFNQWDEHAHPLEPRGNSGIWEGFSPEAKKADLYKFRIRSQQNGYVIDKADPFGVRHEEPPRTASVVWDLEYEWSDSEWMQQRKAKNSLSAPMSIYELHPGSWMRVPEENNRSFSYRELAPRLAQYVNRMNFTHVELLPVMEHPFYGSWGYETTGYFAPTARYGTPQDFMYLVDYLHQHGIGVILDWVPSHFPSDAHGLGYFDGTHLFEHADPRKGFHPDWNTYLFNYGRNEVRSFLFSSAMFWLDKYHADGLRVDAVASMLYLDYSRKQGKWLPNQYGGRENLEAIDFLRQCNQEAYAEQPDVQTFAEESTSWPMVSRPLYVGGLGFGFKWDMGWMHDTLDYFSLDPIHRRFHHRELTFGVMYAWSENFVLPLSHDEVVHGKRSLLDKMPGDRWRKFANLRLLYAYMYGHPGKKLLFMGDELAQWREWNQDESLDWHLLQWRDHQGILKLVSDLNGLCNTEASLHQVDFDWQGYEWLELHDWENSVLAFLRRAKDPNDSMVVICNFTPVVREQYRIGVPTGGYYREALNTDAGYYAGSNIGNEGGVWAVPEPYGGRPYHLSLRLPPLAALYLKTPPVA